MFKVLYFLEVLYVLLVFYFLALLSLLVVLCLLRMLHLFCGGAWVFLFEVPNLLEDFLLACGALPT